MKKALGLLAFAVLGYGQTAEITGRVADASGAAVPAAKISVKNVDTGVEQALRTNDAGYYTTPLLPPGNYEVTAEMQGFQTALLSGI